MSPEPGCAKAQNFVFRQGPRHPPSPLIARGQCEGTSLDRGSRRLVRRYHSTQSEGVTLDDEGTDELRNAGAAWQHPAQDAVLQQVVMRERHRSVKPSKDHDGPGRHVMCLSLECVGRLCEGTEWGGRQQAEKAQRLVVGPAGKYPQRDFCRHKNIERFMTPSETTPGIKLAVEMIPSLAPRIGARDFPGETSALRVSVPFTDTP